MDVLIIIPIYNEKNNICPLTNKILSLNRGLYILFVDDNSQDGTGQIVDDLAKSYEEVRVIHRRRKL